MSKTKSLEEGWRDVSLALTSEELDKAVRALLLVGLEEARGYHLNDCDGCKPDDLCGYHYMQRRIEALGR